VAFFGFDTRKQVDRIAWPLTLEMRQGRGRVTTSHWTLGAVFWSPYRGDRPALLLRETPRGTTMHADKGPCKQATGGEFRCCVAGWPLPSRPRHRPSSLPGLSLFRRNAAVLDHRRRHHHEGREKEGSIKAGPSIVSISQLPRMGPSDCSTWAALARWGGGHRARLGRNATRDCGESGSNGRTGPQRSQSSRTEG